MKYQSSKIISLVCIPQTSILPI